MNGFQRTARNLSRIIMVLCVMALVALVFIASDAKAGTGAEGESNWTMVAALVLCMLALTGAYRHEQASKRHARNVWDAYLQQLGGHDSALHVQEAYRVSAVWWAWDIGMRIVANVCRVLCGHGRKTRGNDNRAHQRGWQLRAVELHLGDKDRAGQQLPVESFADVERRNADSRTMGGKTGGKPGHDRKAVTPGLVSGSGFVHASQIADQSAGRSSYSVQKQATDSQRENEKHVGVGFVARLCEFFGDWKALAAWLAIVGSVGAAQAQVAPKVARWAPMMAREAQSVYGPDAPTPMFLGQIHQESSGREYVTASDGGMGLMQVMPGTVTMISHIFPELGAPSPYDPRWSMRAMARYDGWLYKRVKGKNDCHRWAAALKSYNAGLGYVTQGQAKSPDPETWFGVTEFVPTRQNATNFEYSRTYPHKILFKHQPLYRQLGKMVCPTGEPKP